MKTLRGVAFTAGAVALAAVAVTGCGVEFMPGTSRETKTYDISGSFPALSVHSGSGRLEIVGTDRPGVRVHEYRKWSNSKNKPQTERVVEGSRLTLKSKCAHTVIGYNACGVAYKIEVPKATAADLHTDSGGLRVSGLTGKSLRLDADSGSIRAENIQTATLTATTDSGAITVDGRADTASLRTGSGAIVASALHSTSVSARTSSGAVRLGLTVAPTSVNVSVDSGGVRLRVPDDRRGYAMNLTTDSGGRRIAPELRQDSSSPNKITVRTESGGIWIGTPESTQEQPPEPPRPPRPQEPERP